MVKNRKRNAAKNHVESYDKPHAWKISKKKKKPYSFIEFFPLYQIHKNSTVTIFSSRKARCFPTKKDLRCSSFVRELKVKVWFISKYEARPRKPSILLIPRTHSTDGAPRRTRNKMPFPSDLIVCLQESLLTTIVCLIWTHSYVGEHGKIMCKKMSGNLRRW